MANKPVKIIQGTDRQFSIRTLKSNGDPKDLTGLTTDDITIKMPGTDGDLSFDMTLNANGSGITIASAAGGRITVTLDDIDTALLEEGDGLDMELIFKEGAGPNFAISKVQLQGLLDVKPMLFPT